MKIERAPLDNLLIVTTDIFQDTRGYFAKIYSRDFFEKNGIKADFVEDNQSRSKKYVIRGLHFQWDPPLGKLIRIGRGRAFVASVDIRKKSTTFGRWFGMELSENSQKLMYIPPGIATGFLSLEDATEIYYKYTAPHNPKGESVILWNDPTIGITWPLKGEATLSPRDAGAQTFKKWLRRPESDCF